jgi:hypothetical protein
VSGEPPFTPAEQAIVEAQLQGHLPMFMASRAAVTAWRALRKVAAMRPLEQPETFTVEAAHGGFQAEAVPTGMAMRVWQDEYQGTFVIQPHDVERFRAWLEDMIP